MAENTTDPEDELEEPTDEPIDEPEQGPVEREGQDDDRSIIDKAQDVKDQIDRGREVYDKIKELQQSRAARANQPTPSQTSTPSGGTQPGASTSQGGSAASSGAPSGGAAAGQGGLTAGGSGATASTGGSAAGGAAGTAAGGAGATASTGGAASSAAAGAASGAASTAATGAEIAAVDTVAVAGAPETAGLSLLLLLLPLIQKYTEKAQEKVKKHIKTIVVILLLISMAMWLVLGGLCASILSGTLGKTQPQPAGPNNPNVQALLKAAEETVSLSGPLGHGFAGSAETKKLVFLNDEDKQYVAEGKIDQRLAAVLNYLVQRHEHIRISHIISGYKDMEANPESGSFHDKQIAQNISAHKDGLAADIDEIDLVKKKCDCGAKIPVAVGWQIIGEDPYGKTPDNVLQGITTAQDLIQDDIKAALEEAGVTGLDQAGIQDKLATITGVSSVFDLTNPDVISVLQSVGISGIDNPDLQAGLKRLEALQNIYNLDLTDLNVLMDPNSQAGQLMAQMGVPISPEIKTAIEKYQQTQVLASITSINDLNDPDVLAALQRVGVNTGDPVFQEYLGKMIAAQSLMDWNGSLTDPNITAALEKLGVANTDALKQAMDIYQTAQGAFKDPVGTIMSNPDIYGQLEKMGINIDNPELQNIYNTYKTALQIKNGTLTGQDALTAIANLGTGLFADTGTGAGTGGQLPTITLNADLMKKFQAAQYLVGFSGDLNDPQFKASLEQLGVPDAAIMTASQMLDIYETIKNVDPMALVETYAGQLKTQFPAEWQKYESIQALMKINGIEDLANPDVQAAIANLGISPVSITINKDLMDKYQAAQYLANFDFSGDLTDPKIKESLAKIGVPAEILNQAGMLADIYTTIKDLDPMKILETYVGDKFPEQLAQYEGIKALMEINSMDDLTKPEVQAALGKLGIDTSSVLLTRLGELQQITQIKSIADVQALMQTQLWKDLKLPTNISVELGQLGGIYTLTTIKSPLDLAKPEVQEALGKLGIDMSKYSGVLGQVASVSALMTIRGPEDLLRPDVLKALDDLGIIKLDSQLLGQLGAVQTLMSGDIFSINGVLALNTLGIIGLSNPVTATLMAVQFISSILGISLPGSCNGDTKCYKPTAEKNVETVLGELLDYPESTGSAFANKVTQIITWSQSDVDMYKYELNDLYGVIRPQNFGLFAMPEAYDHLHIAY